MLDITLCVNQFEASTFPFQAAPLEFKLLRKTLLKCPIQVQDLMVISFRKVKSAIVWDKTLLFQMRNLTSPVQILHPSKARFNFPTPWAWTMGKSLWVAWGGMLKLWIDRCIIWCFLLVWLSLRNTTLSLSFETYTRLMLKISRILQKLHQDHFQDERKLNIEIKCK